MKKKAKTATKAAKRRRSAVTGRTVSKKYADEHPETTVTETVKLERKAKRC